MPGPGNAQYGDGGLLTFAANWVFTGGGGIAGQGAIGRTPAGEDKRPRGIYVGDDGITFADGTQQTTASTGADYSGPELVGMEQEAGKNAPDVDYIAGGTGSLEHLNVQDDDLLIAIVGCETDVSGSLAPDEVGWSSLVAPEFLNSALTVGIWYRIVDTGTDPTAYGFTVGASIDLVSMMLRIQGADTTTPFPDAVQKAGDSSGALNTIVCPAITPSFNNALVIQMAFAQRRLGSGVQGDETSNVSGINTSYLKTPNGANLASGFMPLWRLTTDTAGVTAAAMVGGVTRLQTAAALPAQTFTNPAASTGNFQGYSFAISA